MRKSSRSRRPVRRSKRPALAMFGALAIPRMVCPRCGYMAFVIKNKMACCDLPVEANPEVLVRETSPSWERRYYSQQEREDIANAQGGLCIYCGLWFGTTVLKGRREIVLQITIDHLVPFCYDGNDSVLAACQVCNGIKADLVFRTLDEARVHVQNERERQGYDP